jgi:CheY-like chemotaxis protein
VGKRALIVDDSKSARLSLARLLQKHAIEVDTAETAELALEYLGTHRPDAIFMDHQMPGMDGLQAVQAIKANPRTATIPIMMYTSQEGEVYVGQARALGAIGVLPKQIKPTDVTKVLYQLNLAADRRNQDQNGSRLVVENLGGAADDPHHTSTHPALQSDAPLSGGLLREQLTELRRTVLAGFDSQGDRLLADLRTVLKDLPAHASSTEPLPGRVWRLPWVPWAATAVLAGACLVLAILYSGQSSRLSALDAQLGQSKVAAVPELIPPAAAGPPSETVGETAGDAIVVKPLIQVVPFGAEPFSGARLDALRQLFDRLQTQGYSGNVDIRTYSGRFCLVGNATEGFSLAPDDLPYAKCDMVAGGRDDPAASSVRIPVVMADLMSTVRAGSHDMIHVQVAAGEGNNIAAYPPVTEMLTAGEWNHAASANNRVEIRVR